MRSRELDGRTVVLVKPQATGLRTNIVLVTDRRTYTIEAIAQAGQAYSAQIAWCYPDACASKRGPASRSISSISPIVSAPCGAGAGMDCRRACSTTAGAPGSKCRRTSASTDMPPLFVITPEGAELVNYRVQGERYMVDRVFDVAELRLGTRAPIIVRIERETAAPQRRPQRPGAP